jgi:predicted acyl esterase
LNWRLPALVAAALILGAGAGAATDTLPDQVSTQATSTEDTGCELAASTDHTLAPEGVEIHVTVHRPELDDGETAPVILHSHGWAGSRATEATGLVGDLVEDCYGVVSIDMRGHGDSGGQAHVHSPDHEIQDVVGILDWIEEDPDGEFGWVAEDEDVVAGAVGGSYGGGYQLLTAAEDDRLDAIAPNMTWNDLPRALAPDGAVKSVWVDLLYGAGTADARLADFIHQGYAWAQAANEFPSGEAPGEPDVRQRFVDSSPASYPDAIDTPALLMQGVPDTLFTLNEAVDNAKQIAGAGASEVRLVGYHGGHIVHTDATLPSSPAPAGLQSVPPANACGSNTAMILDWFDHHLRDGPDHDLPPVQLALEDGETCLTDTRTAKLVLGQVPGTTYDLEGRVAVTQGAGPATGHLEVADATAEPGSPIQLDVDDRAEERVVTGAAVLRAEATVAGEGAIAYLSLVADDGEDERVLADQTTPVRLDGPTDGQPVEVELAGVASALDPGERLELHVSSLDTMFAHNAQRTPGALVLEDVALDVPVQPAPS